MELRLTIRTPQDDLLHTPRIKLALEEYVELYGVRGLTTPPQKFVASNGVSVEWQNMDYNQGD